MGVRARPRSPAGVGVSALLPLVFSFCEQSMTAAGPSTTTGFGVAAFGVGPLQHSGMTLPAIDGAAVGFACIVVVLAFAIVKATGERT
jgi:hypothetical protein